MYRNKNFKKRPANATANEKKVSLNTIDENTTIKIKKHNEPNATTKTTTVIVHNSNECNDDRQGNAKDLGNLDELFSSEENIPASQEPTQRYLSQRSVLASTLGRTQSRINASQRPPNTYFELVLQKAGVIMNEPEQFVLSCNHLTFVSKFREAFLNAHKYPDNIDIFKIGLSEALNPKSKCTVALKLLSGCIISIPGETSTYQTHNSMIVNFLMIEFLRAPVVKVLMENIEKLACGNLMPIPNTSVPLLPLMLLQLRYVALAECEEIFGSIKNIYKKAHSSAKWDILNSIEYILASSKHDDFTRILLDDDIDDSDIFNINTINVLINLCISPRMQYRLRDKMICYVKQNQCPDNLFAAIIKFMLKIIYEAGDRSLRELIETIREIWLLHEERSAAAAIENEYLLDIFMNIEKGLIISESFYDACQKKITALTDQEFGALDFNMLLLLIQVKEDNFYYIQNLLRRRIKSELVSVNILNEMKSKYAPILEKSLTTLMEILGDFIKERNQAVSDFGRCSFSILFEICEDLRKSIIKKLLELIFDKSVSNMTNLALELLKEIQRKYPKEIQNWGTLLMPLLDRLNEMSLSQTRFATEILCSIAYPAPGLPECAQFQEQVDMSFKKQIIHCSSDEKNQGIVGCVQLIDCMARTENSFIEVEDLNTTYTGISSLPEGRGKAAANLFQLVHHATLRSAESLALFYDELAAICAASPNDHANKAYYDKPFLMWLCEKMTSDFQNNFVIEEPLETINNITLEYKKCINTLEDANTESHDTTMLAIGINIGGLVLNPKEEACFSISVLPPIFNLLRVLHLQRYEGSLELINALLGCAIILPKFFDDANVENQIFTDHNEDVQKKILDIYFHCVNWMRETVSSFATQREQMIRIKVLQRLADLIQIEGRIPNLLKQASINYSPPKCQFILTNSYDVDLSGNTVTPISAKAPIPANAMMPATDTEVSCQFENSSIINENGEQTTMQNLNTQNNTIPVRTNRKQKRKQKRNKSNAENKTFENLYGPKEVYRQMDSNIMLILHEELCLEFPLPANELGHKIGLLELRFVLTDLISKLESITGIRKFQSEEALQYIAKPHYFLNDLSKFLPNILKIMEIIINAMDKRLENAKYVLGNADLFRQDFNYMKVCLGLCLRLLAAYFSWSEFTESAHKTLLTESIAALLPSDGIAAEEQDNVANLTAKLFNKLIKYEKTIIELKTAVHFYQLLETLKRLTSINGKKDILDKQATEIRSLCKTLLQRKWYNYEGRQNKGATCNIYLNELVRAFLKNSNFKRQNEIMHIIGNEAKNLNGKDCVMKSFPNISRANFPLLYRGMCEVLVTKTNDCIIQNDGILNGDRLRIWEKSCDIANGLLELMKQVAIPSNFAIFVKYCHMYLRLVLDHGLKAFEEMLRQDAERVGHAVKNLQASTRFLHHLCCHSKALKNSSIISQIPFLRETVENLVFRFKALLAANKCSNVFLMGDLKNKDIHGDNILPQATPVTSINRDENSSDEEIPDDDSSVDATIFGPEVTINEGEMDLGQRSKSTSRSKCY